MYWTINGGTWRAYDREGDIRYYCGNMGGQPARVTLNDGEIQIEGITKVINLLGEVIFETTLSTHHDMIQLPSGNYVILSSSTYGGQDRVIEVTSSGGTVKDETFGSLFWDIAGYSDTTLKKIIYDEYNIYGGNQSTDWAHANSLVYDESSGIMYFSLRHIGVLAVDYDKWELIWWMAHKDFINTINFTPYPEITIDDITSLQSYKVTDDGYIDGPKCQQFPVQPHSGGLPQRSRAERSTADSRRRAAIDRPIEQ